MRMWPITVGSAAQAAIKAMDPALRHEFIEFMDRLAESPADFLRRADPELALIGGYVASFASATHDGVTIMAIFSGYDDDPPTLLLATVLRRAFDADDEI